MPQQNNSYSFLFADYFIQIAKFFSDFRSFRVEKTAIGASTEIPEQLRVIYGTPSAAFRRIFTVSPNSGVTANQPTINDKPNLPVMNFFCPNFKRVFAKENPFVRLIGTADNVWRDYRGDKVNSTMRAPQQYDLTLQCSIWTNSYKTRDDLISKIVRAFPGGDLYLTLPSNNSEFPNEGLWIPLRIGEDINDETEIEGFAEKETRDIIRTSFEIKMEGVAPYEVVLSKYIEQIQFDAYLHSRGDEKSIITHDGYQLHVLNDDPFSFEIVNPTLNAPVPAEYEP